MQLHGIIVLFEIINLYVTINDTDILDISNLEQAYDILTTKMEDNEQSKLDYNFNDALDILLDNYSDYFYLENDELHIIENLNDLYEILINDIALTVDDDLLQELIIDTRIFKVLDMDIPLEEYHNIFKLNNEIINTYNIISKDETNNITNILNILYLKKLINKLNNKLCNLEYLEIIKIKMCIAHYNSVLNDDSYEFDNLGWHIALFSNDNNLKSILNHEKIAYIIDEVDPIDDDSLDEEETIIKHNIKTLKEDNSFNYEIPYFLSALYLRINNYLKKDIPPFLKNSLIFKKNLLLSTPELKNMEDYFLEHGNFFNYELPKFTKYSPEERFTSLYNETLRRILYLDYPDKEIDNNRYVDIVINILFIKNYLDLSLNKERNNEIINQIIFSKFYQNHNYTLINNLLKEILFNNQSIKER